MTGLAACEQQEKALPQSVINARIDSEVKQKMIDIKKQEMEDLDQRMAIEVKAKADSIIQIREAATAKKDTANKKPTVIKHM